MNFKCVSNSKVINQNIDTEEFCDISSVPNPGGLGARAPPPPPQKKRGSVCPKKTFFVHYMILRVYTAMHNWERLPR